MIALTFAQEPLLFPQFGLALSLVLGLFAAVYPRFQLYSADGLNCTHPNKVEAIADF